MAEAAHRMRPMRERRRARALRELRLIVPDPIPGPFGDGSLGSSPAWTEQRRETRCGGSKRSRNLTPSEAGRGRDGSRAGRLREAAPSSTCQADALPAGHSSVVIWQMTPGIAAAPDFRSPSNLPKKRLADALANHGG